MSSPFAHQDQENPTHFPSTSGTHLAYDPAQEAMQIQVIHPALCPLLLLGTLGLYHAYFVWRTFKTLHARGATNTAPGLAIGLLFVPLVNVIWFIFVWGELGMAIAREYRRQQLYSPATALTWAYPIAILFGIVLDLGLPGVGLIWNLVWGGACLAQTQSWLNELARRESSQALQVAGNFSPQPGLQLFSQKNCPRCGEFIALSAYACRFCDAEFDATDVHSAIARMESVRTIENQDRELQSLNLRCFWQTTVAILTGVVGLFFLFIAVVAAIEVSNEKTLAEGLSVAAVGVLIFAVPCLTICSFCHGGRTRALKRAKQLREIREKQSESSI